MCSRKPPKLRNLYLKVGIHRPTPVIMFFFFHYGKFTNQMLKKSLKYNCALYSLFIFRSTFFFFCLNQIAVSKLNHILVQQVTKYLRDHFLSSLTAAFLFHFGKKKSNVLVNVFIYRSSWLASAGALPFNKCQFNTCLYQYFCELVYFRKGLLQEHGHM